MRAGSPAAGVEVPPQVGGIHLTTVDFVHQLLVAFFTDRTADDLANLREEHVGTLHGRTGSHDTFVADRAFLSCLPVCCRVLFHVERLDGTGVVGHDDRLLEVLLHQVALMFACQVVAPVAGELKLLALLDGFLQDVDTFGIGQAHEGFLEYTLQTLQEGLVDHLVEELQVVLAVVQCPTDTVFNEVFFQVHQLLLVEESHFRLHHPELCKVARRVAVLGAEGGSEGIDGTQCRRPQLTL